MIPVEIEGVYCAAKVGYKVYLWFGKWVRGVHVVKVRDGPCSAKLAEQVIKAMLSMGARQARLMLEECAVTAFLSSESRSGIVLFHEPALSPDDVMYYADLIDVISIE